MLNWPGTRLHVNPTVHQDVVTGQIGEAELQAIKQANEADRNDERRRDGENSSKNSGPKLSRARTHNDQLIVGTCGVILARQSMFNSEALSALKVCHLLHLFFSSLLIFFCPLLYLWLFHQF